MSNPVYAIGDIHGQLDLLHEVLERITADGGTDAEIVFLGDYVDRGANSQGVLELLANGHREGRNWTFLRGNHDRLMHWFLMDPPQHDPYLLVNFTWLHPRIGGMETLASYGVDTSENRRVKDIVEDARAAIPKSHLELLGLLKPYVERKDLLFVHAGIRPGIALEHQSEDDLFWIRQEFHDHDGPHPHLIVHGHTPIDAATHYGNRVNLDTGAGYGKPLSAAVFEAGEVCLLTDRGRKRLIPQIG